MIQEARSLPQRAVFMDKIRYAIVLVVVVLHAACAFSNLST